MNYQVNIANTTPEDFGQWMLRRAADIGFTAIPATSMWAGATEHGIAAQLWDIDRFQLAGLLDRYGHDHPSEEAFGVMPLPSSFVYWNTAHDDYRKAA